ncbi:GHKL domain-containing protein [Deferribacteraceae bacterium V6Fe1]|nr:GHKL domain-containing protein [Deferribacteraceae bacterium V6Fe1]
MKKINVKTKIALLISFAGFLTSLFFSLILYFELAEQPFDLLDSILKEEATRVIEYIDSDLKTEQDLLRDFNRYWVKIFDTQSGKVIFKSELAKRVNIKLLSPGKKITFKNEISNNLTAYTTEEKKDVIIRVNSYNITTPKGTYIVQIGRHIEGLENEVLNLLSVLVYGLILSMFLLFVISWVIAGKILKPVSIMKNLTQEISEKNIGVRVPVGEADDEFSQLAKTINKMLDRLQYSFKKQKDFLYNTSHELKTPLSTIRIGIDESLLNTSEEIPDKIKYNLTIMRKRILKLEKLIKDLLNLSALEAENVIDKKSINIANLLKSLIDDYEILTKAKNIKINCNIEYEKDILCDEKKIYRALSNLIDNAIKYNIENGTIEISIKKSGKFLLISISNTSMEISKEELPLIFEQFYRIEKSRSEDEGGSGLGLAIVKKIIELHNGNIKVESKNGWTTISISLPISN